MPINKSTFNQGYDSSLGFEKRFFSFIGLFKV